MTRLPLSPLPSMRTDDSGAWENVETEGFVDERWVSRMVAEPMVSRHIPRPADLVLSACDDDFAGWKFPESSPFQVATPLAVTTEATYKRAKPPELEEPGIGVPASGKHRWWMAGLAGAVTTSLFAILLLSLSSRPMPDMPFSAPAHAPVMDERAKSGVSSPDITLNQTAREY